MYCADEGAHPSVGDSGLVEHEGQPEIDKLEAPVSPVVEKQEVFGFEISMSNVLGVAIVECQYHLPEHDTRFFLREESLLNDLVEELPAGTQPTSSWKVYSVIM